MYMDSKINKILPGQHIQLYILRSIVVICVHDTDRMEYKNNQYITQIDYKMYTHLRSELHIVHLHEIEIVQCPL